jgi:hypothetical protein
MGAIRSVLRPTLIYEGGYPDFGVKDLWRIRKAGPSIALLLDLAPKERVAWWARAICN